MTDTLFWILISLPVFLLSGSIHEFAHAWMAKRLGDYTATMRGRLTINPLAHIDPFGLILLLVARFGWMKPVPYIERNFRHPVRDSALVALAGPVSNIVLVFLGSLVIRLLGVDNLVTGVTMTQASITAFISLVMYIFVWTNAALAVFNMMPVPPLDGYRIMRALLPTDNLRRWWEDLEKYSFIIILFIFLPLSPFGDLASKWVYEGVSFILSIFLL